MPLQEHKLIYVEAEEPRPTVPVENGHNNGDHHDEFYIDPEPEPIKAALISQDIMDVLDSYTPGSLGMSVS